MPEGSEVTRYYVIRFSLRGGKETWSFTRFLPEHVLSYEDTPLEAGPHRYYVGALSAHGSGRRTGVDVEVHATTAAMSTGLH